MINVVHFQFMNDKEQAKRLFGQRQQFVASIVPNLLDPSMKTAEGDDIYGRIHPANNFYPDWAKTLFAENKDNPNVIWVQEGYRHCCGRCHIKREENRRLGRGDFPDSHHEHVCLDGDSQTLERQIEVIKRGKILLGKFGIVPKGYCPPNHLGNIDTKVAASILDFKFYFTRNGFDYFIPGLIELPAYSEVGLTVIPESYYKGTRSPALISYYDRMDAPSDIPMFRDFYVDLKPLKAEVSDKLIIAHKKLRDLKARLKR